MLNALPSVFPFFLPCYSVYAASEDDLLSVYSPSFSGGNMSGIFMISNAVVYLQALKDMENDYRYIRIDLTQIKKRFFFLLFSLNSIMGCTRQAKFLTCLIFFRTPHACPLLQMQIKHSLFSFPILPCTLVYKQTPFFSHFKSSNL